MSSSVQVPTIGLCGCSPCNESAKDTEKTGDGFFKHCPAAKVGGSLCQWVALVSHSHPQHSFLKMCPCCVTFSGAIKNTVRLQ